MVAAVDELERVALMPELTTNANDPRLGHGSDSEPRPQQDVYLVLSDEERAKGFVRPVRHSYKHVGIAGPRYPIRDLTPDEHERYDKYNYVKYEAYPESESPATGRFWTQAQLDTIGKGCQTVTTMGQALAETWARDPYFYGATYCVHCQMHIEVDRFVWVDDGTRLGS